MAYGNPHGGTKDGFCPKIKKAMSQGHSLDATHNPGNTRMTTGKRGNEFLGGGGFKVIQDSAAGSMSYGSGRVASSPLMSRPKKSWRSSGSRSRASRSEY